MTARDLILAVQFLTRLPTPKLSSVAPEDFSRAAVWFPAVGLLIGAALAAALWVGTHISPPVGALLALIVWAWITGALHLDGLCDVADALGAAHRNRDRFLEVLRDPHAGTFGVVAVALQLLAKYVLLVEIAGAHALVALVLVPAWARWGPLVWAVVVPPLAPGSGERFAWNVGHSVAAAQGLALLGISVLFAPALVVAPVIVFAIAVYWRARLGGMTGDCHGASIEATETLLLAGLVLGNAMR